MTYDSLEQYVWDFVRTQTVNTPAFAVLNIAYVTNYRRGGCSNFDVVANLTWLETAVRGTVRRNGSVNCIFSFMLISILSIQ